MRQQEGEAVDNQFDGAVETGAESPLLSVIMACRNGEQYVERQLEALASQETSFPWELLFVNNRSTDLSVQIAERYKGRIPLRVVSAPERANQAYARNVGADVARAEKLVFVDADDEVAPGFMTSMFAALQEHDFVGTPSDRHALNPDWCREAHNTSESTHGVFAPFAGAAVGVSGAAFASVGGWPEEYAPCEDMALSFRLQRSGIALTFLPEPLFHYRLRNSIRGLFSQARAWGRAEVRVHRDFGPTFAARRPASLALSEWLGVLRQMAAARSRADLARCAVRLGYSVGRLQGSLRHHVFYL
jgi:cellulose synthase/poly-beta-1,6-N-acetylglucosamine synthase-like glycosyltransferase